MADMMTLVETIIRNLQNRRGFDQAFDLDEETLAEIKQEMADAIDAAVKQRERDEKDAARYRWLRNKSGRNGMPYIRCDDPPFEPMDYWITAGTADSCIDRAMAQEAGNEPQ